MNNYLHKYVSVHMATIIFEVGIVLALAPFIFVYLFDLGVVGGALANLFFVLAIVLVFISIMIVPSDKLLRKNLPISKKAGIAYIVGGKFLIALFFILSFSTMFQNFTSIMNILLDKEEPDIVVGEIISINTSPFVILFSKDVEVLYKDNSKLRLEYRYSKGIELDRKYRIMLAPKTKLILSVDSI